MSRLAQTDPIMDAFIKKEEDRQNNTINLIASENYTPEAVREVAATVLTNKYAEGYPGKRYYGGCQIVDEIEQLAIERCEDLFGAEHANIQPHAGSQANMAAYYALLQPGDTILGMSLAEGGHLTHGHKVNFSGTFFKSVSYTVDPKTELLDYNQIAKLGEQHKPKLIIAGASAYSRAIDFEQFAIIAQNVGAYFLADIAHISGLVAAKLHQSPIPYANVTTSTTHKTLRGPRGGIIMCKKELGTKIDKAVMPGTQGGPLMHIVAAKGVAFHLAQQHEFIEYQKQIIKNAQAMVDDFKEKGYRIVADGTDNHMFVIDLRNKNINGKIAEAALQKVGISVSRSCIPFDPEPPWITSGIRIGTPAVTTRGMEESEMQEIVNLTDETLQNHENEKKLNMIKQKIQNLCSQYPI